MQISDFENLPCKGSTPRYKTFGKKLAAAALQFYFYNTFKFKKMHAFCCLSKKTLHFVSSCGCLDNVQRSVLVFVGSTPASDIAFFSFFLNFKKYKLLLLIFFFKKLFGNKYKMMKIYKCFKKSLLKNVCIFRFKK